MTPPKTLLETAMRCCTMLRDLPVHEKATVLQIVGSLLQAEAKSLELAQLQQHSPPPVPPIDEHYRA